MTDVNHAEGKRMKQDTFLPDDYRPVESEPFMNERQVEYFRRKLLNWKNELLEGSRDTIEGWCTGGIGIVGGAASAIIGRLRVDTRLTLQGEMVFIEESDDLVVDSIENGQWTGVIRTADDEGPPFNGTFDGPMDGAPEMMGLEE